MIPNWSTLTTLAYGGASAMMARLLREDEPLPISPDALRTAEKTVSRYQNLVSDVDVNKPQTFLNPVHSLIKKKKQLSESTNMCFPTWVNRHYGMYNFSKIHPCMPDLMTRVVYENTEQILQDEEWAQSNLSDKVDVAGYYKNPHRDEFVHIDSGAYGKLSFMYAAPSGSERSKFNQDPRVNPRTDGSACSWIGDVIEAYRELVWDNRIKKANGKLEVVDHTPPDDEYVGPMEDWVGRVEKQFHADQGWSMLLCGRPGVGKTTFAWSMVQHIGARTLFLSKETLSYVYASSQPIDGHTIDNVIEYIYPEIIIIDDPDYLSSAERRSLMDTLPLMREVADLVLITCNDMSAFSEALLRPGRTDCIVEVKSPSEDHLYKMLKSKADDIGVDVPQDEDIIERLCKIMWAMSPAHMLEAMRRGHIWGWDDPHTFDVELHQHIEDGDENPEDDMDAIYEAVLNE